MKIDLSETKPVYEIHIWYYKTEPPLGEFDDFEKFDDKDKALEAYHKLDCAYKILMEYAGDDGDVLLEYSRSDAKKMVEDSGLIDDNDGWLDVHYRKIAHLLIEVKQAREIVPKLSRFIGEMIPWIADEPEGNGIFVGEAVEWNYDESGEWVLVNYNETRWVTMSYIEVRNTPKYREQVGLKEEEE